MLKGDKSGKRFVPANNTENYIFLGVTHISNAKNEAKIED